MKHIKLFESYAKKMVLIVGLPGSGKSQLTKQINDGSFVEFDDPEKREWDKELDSFGEPWAPIKKELSSGKNVIINSGDFTEPGGEDLISFFQNLGKSHNYSVRTIYFENNPEQCIKNLEGRNFRKMKKDMIYYASKNYKIPIGAETVPVYTPK